MLQIVSCLILVASASEVAIFYARPDAESLKVLHVSEAIALMQAYLEEHPDSADAWLHLGSIHANAYARGMDAVEIVHDPAGDKPPAPQNMGIPPKTAARRLDSVSEPRLTHLAQAVRAFQQAVKHAGTSSKEQALVGLGYALYECHDRFEKVPWSLAGEPFDAETKVHGAEPQWWKDQALVVFRQIEMPQYSDEDELWSSYQPGNAKSVASMYIVQISNQRSTLTELEEKELARLKEPADRYLQFQSMYPPIKPESPPQPREIEAIYPVTPAGSATAELYLRALDAMFLEIRMENDLPIIGTDFEEKYRGNILAPDILKRVGNYLGYHAETFRLMGEAARGTECRYPIDFTKGVAIELPFLAGLRQLGRLQALRALHAAASGDSATLTMAISDGIALADSLRREPLSVSQNVRMALIGILITALEDAQNRMALDSNDLRVLQKRLSTLEGLDGLIAMLKGDSYLKQMEFSEPIELTPIPDELKLSAEERAKLLKHMKERAAARPTPDAVRAAYSAMLAAALLAFPEAYEEFERADLDEEFGSTSEARNLLGFYRCQALLRAAQIALAVDRYSRTNSGPPESLNDLVPVYIRELPLDPFTDEPMRYELLDGGFMVYSVGDNLVDDNGGDYIESGPNQMPVRMADVVYKVGRGNETEEGDAHGF